MCGSSGVPGQVTFQCSFSNDLESLTCSVDGGESEECELPLVFDIDELGEGFHNVVLRATDQFGQTLFLSFNFSLTTPRKSNRTCCSEETNVNLFSPAYWMQYHQVCM